MNFYRDWSEGDIRKLQMFLSREDMLGDAAYDGDYDGKMGPKTIAAIKAYQKKQGVTADGMWGTNTNKHHKVITSGIVSKSPYKKSHRYEAGNFVKHPTAYSELTWHDLPTKNVADAIAYFSAYPEKLFSEDMEASKWRQIFHNSGKEGADFINQVFMSLSPEDRKKVDNRRLTQSYLSDEFNGNIREGSTNFAANLLPVMIGSVALPMTATALVGGAAVPTLTGLVGSYYGSKELGKAGKKIGHDKGVKNQDQLYTDPSAEKYGVAGVTHDPKRRIREAEQKGEMIGSLTGSVIGGFGGTALGTAGENAVINTMGAGRAMYAPKTNVVVETTPSVRPYNTIELGTVKGPSQLKLFTEGVKARLNPQAGQTRAGGVYGVKHHYNGKTYNPGNWMDEATLARAKQDWYNPQSPYKMNIGGAQNTGRGVKIGQSMGVNWPGVGYQTALNTPTYLSGSYADNLGDATLVSKSKTNSAKKEERKEKRQERHKKLIERTAESTTD